MILCSPFSLSCVCVCFSKKTFVQILGKKKKMFTHKKGGQVEYGKSQTAIGLKPPQIVECYFFFRDFQRMTFISDDNSLSSN